MLFCQMFSVFIAVCENNNGIEIGEMPHRCDILYPACWYVEPKEGMQFSRNTNPKSQPK